jgi:hypothetical protein
MSVASANEPVLAREPPTAQTGDTIGETRPPEHRPTGHEVAQPSWAPRVRAIRRVGHEPDRVELEGPHVRVKDLARALADRIRQRPLASLAAAIGVGFLVGGALTFRAGRIALAAAARHVARVVLKQVL